MSDGWLVTRRWLVAAALLWMGGLLGGCAQDEGYGNRATRYGDGRPVYPRPYYREYGPWDLPSTSSYPGPPTWYGCPQGAAACYPD